MAVIGGLVPDLIRHEAKMALVEDALRESERRFAFFMLHLPAAAWMKDLQERYIYANGETERIFSMSLAALQGRTDEEFLPLETARNFCESDRRVLTKGRSLKESQVFRGTDGTERHFLTSKFVVPDTEGLPAYIAGVAFDITDRSRAETEIVRLNTELHLRAGELENANRELEDFNYTVAHDLRRPLTVINGYSQILRELNCHNLDHQSLGYLKIIYDSTLSMGQMLDALLNFFQLLHAKLHPETVDLSAVVREVASELQQADPERLVSFRIADKISVEGDTELLRVVVSNLLGNAWKYTVGRQEAMIEFGASDLDGETVCFVRDNGIGFKREDAKKLFLPFHRLSGNEGISGFGIGRATVEWIIRCHRGKIWWTAPPARGQPSISSWANGVTKGPEPVRMGADLSQGDDPAVAVRVKVGAVGLDAN